ncbi:hypothetical protein PULV_b0403 [Pseudoalteromonas ulvae UL12]|uniref:hypothetical protein n=1 Tax=Pseudoalteromonas ulvae TaxID=107327 RepID=UPI00186B959C|nr:hypothetical protein [Pseudoalteromonas ulvae]MBE0365752.1 hypothetical protein [Pseudoalteromonas ulvae UL12]
MKQCYTPLTVVTALCFVSACQGTPLTTLPSNQYESTAKNCQVMYAPASIVGYTINQIVDQPNSKPLTGFATQGAITLRYDGAQKMSGFGVGDVAHQLIEGQYAYHRVDATTAIEQAVDFEKGAYITYYHFQSEQAGTFEQTYSSGAVLKGRFTMLANNDGAPLAPESLSGLNVALTIDSAKSLSPDGYPTSGLVVQTYAQDGQYAAKGIGQGNIDSIGRYQYQRISANTAVETAMQTSDFFTLPYTMVYTFTSADSGLWYQNFANGTIIFEGRFKTFK